jgi:integrase
MDTGDYVKPSKLTVAEHLTEWLRDYVTIAVRPRTFEGYSMIVRKHLIPSLGSNVLTQL